MRRGVCKKLIFLFAALSVLIAFACVSVSKFVITDKKELVGTYTAFVLSHDGEGQTAVMQTDKNGDTTGYIVVTVSNFTDEKVSKRDVRFSLRVPTADELKATKVTDAWGAEHALAADSKYYDVTIVDENDKELTDTSAATLLSANAKNSSSLLLKIKRKATAEPMASDETERISIILQTSEPYKDLQVFDVNTTTARLSVGVSSDEYQGFTRETVNLKSATEFIRSPATPDLNASYLATVEFALSGEVVFDAARYRETYGFAPVFNSEQNKYAVTIRSGADVNLYFYVRGNCTVTVSAKIADGSTAQVEEKVSGVNDDKIVFQRKVS
ncbi:MAG: hypothetical protein PUH90_04685 [Clostridia bacterium]|nr:hypothetical protein [Clostridia bacterium]